MKTPPLGHGHTPAELLADLIQHTPGVIDHFPFVPLPAELALPVWAGHLGKVWAPPRQLAAPSNYDEAHNNLSPPARAEFLAALRRMHRAVWHELINDYTGESLFGTLSWREDEPAPAYATSELHTLTTRGAAQLLGWLHWRELTPVEQLLAALSTVQIANANLTLNEATHPPCLFVPNCAPGIEAARFAKLFAEFRQYLPSKPSKLRGLATRLAELRALPLAMLREGPARELPTRFPTVKWDGLSNSPADSSETETFWPDLEQALRTRTEWAARAYDAVLALATPATLSPVLTPEQTEICFDLRLAEFQNIVDISYSTPDDDTAITVYDVSETGHLAGGGGLWCPMQTAGAPHESWLNYGAKKREAIRLGFVRGLYHLIGHKPFETLADWRSFQADLRPHIFKRQIIPLTEEADRTGDYAKAVAKIEEHLRTVYEAGQHIPYHPNFENELITHLNRVPLTGIDDFLTGFSQRKELATPEGYAYLLNVAIPLAEAPEAGRRTVMERVVSWLRLALDTPAAPAIAEPSQPGSLIPNKGCPHLGDTLDTAAPVAPTVADLCRQPFTPADLNRLLTSLNVLTEKLTLAGPTYCLSGSVNKKGAVRISKTFAALTELNKNGLLNWVGWQAVMKAPPYGLTFGEKALAYEYKSKNTRRRSNTFDAAIEYTQRWLQRWRTAYNSQKQP